MILLDTNTKLEVVLSSVPTTELDWVTTYIDTTDDIPKHTDGTTNGTTDVDMISAPAADKRLIRTLNIFNNDNLSRNVIVKTDTGGTERILIHHILKANSTLIYDSQAGWYVTPIELPDTVTWVNTTDIAGSDTVEPLETEVITTTATTLSNSLRWIIEVEDPTAVEVNSQLVEASHNGTDIYFTISNIVGSRVIDFTIEVIINIINIELKITNNGANTLNIKYKQSIL